MKNTVLAIKHYEAAIKLNPNKGESFYNLGNALCVVQKYDDAIENYKKVITFDSYNAPAFFNLGNAYYMCG